MNKYSLLVFDWDGTLLDSKSQIVNCMQSTIRDMSLEARTDKQISDIIGLGLNEAIRALFPDFTDKNIQQVSQAYREHYLNKAKGNNTALSLFEGAKAVLDELRGQGYDLAVATGKSRRGLDNDLENLGMSDFFPITRCADETRSKPHPQMLQEILTDFNTPAQSALMIGDSEYDLQLANNAHVDGFAVSYGVHGLIRLLKQDPIGFIDNIAQLPSWLSDHAQIDVD